MTNELTTILASVVEFFIGFLVGCHFVRIAGRCLYCGLKPRPISRRKATAHPDSARDQKGKRGK